MLEKHPKEEEEKRRRRRKVPQPAGVVPASGRTPSLRGGGGAGGSATLHLLKGHLKVKCGGMGGMCPPPSKQTGGLHVTVCPPRVYRHRSEASFRSYGSMANAGNSSCLLTSPEEMLSSVSNLGTFVAKSSGAKQWQCELFVILFL